MHWWKFVLAGMAAGAVNGLFGAGGGMILLPILGWIGILDKQSLFPASVCIMLPICVTSLLISGLQTAIPFSEALPYLLGSIPGGILAGKFAQRIPLHWLHRGLGLMILWGGIRYLC